MKKCQHLQQNVVKTKTRIIKTCARCGEIVKRITREFTMPTVEHIEVTVSLNTGEGMISFALKEVRHAAYGFDVPIKSLTSVIGCLEEVHGSNLPCILTIGSTSTKPQHAKDIYKITSTLQKVGRMLDDFVRDNYINEARYT